MSSNFKLLPILISLLICSLSDSFAQSNHTEGISEAPTDSVLEREKRNKEEEQLGPLEPLDPAKSDDPDYVAEKWWRHLGYRSKEEAAKALKRDKKRVLELGFLKRWEPPQPGDPNHVSDYFEMPQDELLSDCGYVPGYTYPTNCMDENGKLIFNPEVDGQEVLDSIVKKQKGKLGKYNKIPNNKPGN